MAKPELINTTTDEFFDRGYLMHLVGGSDSREEILQYAESMYCSARRNQRLYVVDNMTGEVIFDKVKE